MSNARALRPPMAVPWTVFLAALSIAALWLALGTPALANLPNGVPESRSHIHQMVVEEATAAGVPTALALAVAKVESNFNPRALSSAGARGVMQIMPKTGRDLYGVHEDRLWDARLNVQLGVAYLKSLHERYGRWDLALSHYNGGSRVGTPPNARVIPATRGYVNSVLAWQRRFERDTTAVAIADAVERQRAAQDGQTGDATPYWVFDRPAVERDWRHYLNVADYWLAAARNGGVPPTDFPAPPQARPVPGPGADHGETPAPWNAEPSDVRPSDDFRRSVDNLGQRFRDRLRSGERPWGGRYEDGYAPVY